MFLSENKVKQRCWVQNVLTFITPTLASMHSPPSWTLWIHLLPAMAGFKQPRWRQPELVYKPASDVTGGVSHF